MTDRNERSMGSGRPDGPDACRLDVPWWASGLMTWSDDVDDGERVDGDLYRLLDDDTMGLGLLQRIAG